MNSSYRVRTRPANHPTGSPDQAVEESPAEDSPDSGYEVGYCRPPVHTRFKKGQRANPNGRPKGAKNLRTLAQEKLGAKVTVREGGREKKMSKAEIGMTKLANKFAETGDPKILVVLQKLEGGEGGGAPAPSAASRVLTEQETNQNKAILAWFLKMNAPSSEGDGHD